MVDLLEPKTEISFYLNAYSKRSRHIGAIFVRIIKSEQGIMLYLQWRPNKETDQRLNISTWHIGGCDWELYAKIWQFLRRSPQDILAQMEIPNAPNMANTISSSIWYKAIVFEDDMLRMPIRMSAKDMPKQIKEGFTLVCHHK